MYDYVVPVYMIHTYIVYHLLHACTCVRVCVRVCECVVHVLRHMYAYCTPVQVEIK